MASNHPDEGVREAPTPTTSQKACLGALFFSQTRLVKGDPPFCTGISRRRSYPAPVSSSETMPSGAFNYICLGYSVHDPAKLRSAAANLKPGDPVQVPWCSGVEIISASAVASQRELLPADGQPLDRPTSAASSSHDRDLRRHKADRRKLLSSADLPPSRAPDWDGFTKRFVRISNAIIDKMHANASYMVKAVERTWDQVLGKEKKP